MKKSPRFWIRTVIWGAVVLAVALCVWVALTNDAWIPINTPPIIQTLGGGRELDLWLPAVLLMACASPILVMLWLRLKWKIFIERRRRARAIRDLSSDAPMPD